MRVLTAAVAPLVLFFGPVEGKHHMMKAGSVSCDDVSNGTMLAIESDTSSQPARVHVTFANNTDIPLGFPVEQEPSFKPSTSDRTLTIWFGYFDEVYGSYRARYMVPPMRIIPPGEKVRFQITSPDLVRQLTDGARKPVALARIATRELRESRTRGEQPLEDYIENSCTVRSASSVGPR
jgi:hypothetical protein